jgi:hypothetical protein
MYQYQRPKNNSAGPRYMSNVSHSGVSRTVGSALTSTACSCTSRSSSARSANSGTSVEKFVVAVASASGYRTALSNVPSIPRPFAVIVATFPSPSCAMNVGR